MTKTVRYCINCGRQIGEEHICTNPDCGGIPNFYRDVPGPEPKAQVASRRAEKGAGRGAEAERAAALHSIQGGASRHTVPIDSVRVAVLRGLSPPRAEHILQAGTTSVGAVRPARLIIDRPEISSRHARLECRPGSAGHWEVTIVDEGSTNGTFVNGKRVKSQVLKPGDRVRFAKAEFEFQLLADPQGHGSPRVTIGF